jgi:oxygen-independent coproporphyrinogen III oxidase
LSLLGLYLHIPFCQAICSYCNFNRGLMDRALKARYVAALEQEIRRGGDGRDVDTIFFGGGTPSLLEPDEVARVIRACREAYRVTSDVEITLETNPETASQSKFEGWRDAGVNRISLGVQSFDDEQLRRLGRIHSAARVGEVVEAARAAGLDNLSLDLMFWLPGQSRASWAESVRRAIALSPDHLSLYLLELYPNAPLRESMARASAAAATDSAWAQAPDDEAADMYLEALDQLDRAGYRQYEISNVARPGRESRHNLKYWMSGDWRGMGCGAHSTVAGRRWQNVAGTVDYVERIEQEQDVAIGCQTLTDQAQQEEALFTGLRLTRGVSRPAFRARYGYDPVGAHGPALAPAIEGGFVWVTDTAFGLTRTGMLLANEILAVFV